MGLFILLVMLSAPCHSREAHAWAARHSVALALADHVRTLHPDLGSLAASRKDANAIAEAGRGQANPFSGQSGSQIVATFGKVRPAAIPS